MSPESRFRKAALRVEREKGVRTHHPSGQCPPSTNRSAASLFDALREQAEKLGLERIGVTDSSPFPNDHDRFKEWLDRGFGADMKYLTDGEVAGKNPRAFPDMLLPEVKSIVVAAVSYPAPLRNDEVSGLLGNVANYARGLDYHHVIKDRLLLLADALADLLDKPILARVSVDTGPLLERSLAVRAGLGFVGKNTLLLSPGRGSHFLLGELLTDVELEAEAPIERPGCGRCTACLTACPTSAFAEPYVLDARRCISYQTIENVGPIDRELRENFGNRVFGCDACQSSCPYNQSGADRATDPAFSPDPRRDRIELEKLLFLGSAGYRTLVKGSAFRRTSCEQLCRNAAVALGNSGDEAAVPALERAIHSHPLRLARTHAAWAISRLADHFDLESAKLARDRLLSTNLDPEIVEELRNA